MRAFMCCTVAGKNCSKLVDKLENQESDLILRLDIFNISTCPALTLGKFRPRRPISSRTGPIRKTIPPS